MEYNLDTRNRKNRIYDMMGYRLTLEDLFAKLKIFSE